MRAEQVTQIKALSAILNLILNVYSDEAADRQSGVQIAFEF